MAVLISGHQPAFAGAWSPPAPRGVVMWKLDLGVEYAAARYPIMHQSFSLFVERGLSRDLSVELQTGVQSNRYDHLRRVGPGEQAIGLKHTFVDWGGVVLSGYIGERMLVDLGAGPFARDRTEWRTEGRGAFGANFQTLGVRGFVDFEGTQLYGGGGRLQSREDARLGLSIDRQTQTSLSLRAGQDRRERFLSSWTTLEASAVRSFGVWKVEVGWKKTSSAPWPTDTSGPVISLWRTF